jgi:hypothetical protein
MENLHLTYDEVVRKIPYRNLLIMQKDKLHIVYGSKVKATDGKSMAEKRRKNKR